MRTIFTVISFPTIKQKLDIRSNGMVTLTTVDFRIFHFLPIRYDRAWQLISKKCNLVLWFSFFFQIFDFKTWKIRRTSYKIYWENRYLQKFSAPPFWSMLMGLQITPRPCCGQITAHNIYIEEREKGLNRAIYKFFMLYLGWALELLMDREGAASVTHILMFSMFLMFQC